MKNVIEKAEAMKGKINPYYDLRYGETMEIYGNSSDPFALIVNSFRFGYMQGMKAAKAEMKANKRLERSQNETNVATFPKRRIAEIANAIEREAIWENDIRKR